MPNISKLIRRTLFTLGVGVIAATSFGLSYFYFENTRSESTSTNTFKVDDIKENYPFGKSSSSSSTYTLYFFPNASYMHLYHEYLEGGGSIAPEDQFGYKEVQYNEAGNVLTDSNGNARYKLSEVGQYSEDNCDNTKITYDGAFRKYIGTHFPNDNFEADGGSAYASGGAFSETYSALSVKRTWGEPGEDFTIFPDADGREEKYNGHNQYSLDRLGCWEESYYYGKTVTDGNGDQAITGFINETNDKLNDTNTGRYIPIKITVTNTLSMDVYEAAIQDLFASMGNSKDWHNYSFTEWTYVYKDSDDKYVYPYSYLDNKEAGSASSGNVGEAFQPKTIDTYFDLFTDLKKYADENNVIRLFPMFSNGKKTSGDDRTFLNGGGATEKLQITYGDKNVYKYPLFTSDTYNDGAGNFTYGDDSEEELLKSEYIRLFSYNNIEIKTSSNISSLNFSANNVWGSTKTEAIGNWNGATTDNPHWSGLFWGSLYTLSSDYIQNNLIAKYGEGLYTFYVFVANYSYQNGPGSGTSNSESQLRSTFDNFYDNVVSQAANGKFSSLNNKTLVRVDYDESNYYQPYKCSPTVIAFEKIDEPKVIRDYPLNDSQGVDNATTINNYISSNYSLAPSFYRNNDYLYEGSKNDDTYSYKNTTDLSADRPYTYIARNVDFVDMENQSLYFLIAFGESYLTHNSFSGSNTYDYLVASSSQIDDASTEITEATNVFTSASEYIEIADVADSSDSSKTYQMCKFKSLQYIGVYDILITRTSGNNTNNPYEIYMYRHTNMFCKLFDQDLDPFEAGQFVNHTSTTSTLLFQKQYFLGQSVQADDVSVAGTYKDKTLDQCFRSYVSFKETGTASEDYSKSTLTQYRILDRVTEAVVAEYKLQEDGSYALECNFRINKNYIFYMQKNS